MKIFHARRSATLDSLSLMRRELARCLADLRVSRDIADALQLALSELGANAVAHSATPPRHLEVNVAILGAGLRFEFSDDGSITPRANQSGPADKEASTDVESESGRGLALTRQAFDRSGFEGEGWNRFVGWRSLRPLRPVVMVVEDSPPLLALYASYLRAEYRVVACSSLTEARQALATANVDAILADINLGDGLGTALAEEPDSSGPDFLPPVLLISSDTSAGMRDAALRAGAEFFLAKPVRGGRLREMVAMALNRSLARRARLARTFARELDSFASAGVPPVLTHHLAEAFGGTAATGGGDIVLHFQRPEFDRVILIDVMGHGVAAKAWAIAYVAIIRTIQHLQPELPPSAFLETLARFAWRDASLESALATMLVVDLDATGATIASAGHPAPAVFEPELRRIAIEGPLLGVSPPAPYASQRISLKTGARLVMITDGIDPANIVTGRELPEWLTSALSDSRCLPMNEAALALRETAERSLGPRPLDDWTIVMLEPRRPN